MNPWDGIFIYKDGQLYNHPNRKHHLIKHDVPVGNATATGCLIFTYQNRTCQVHRVIYEIHNGPIPDEMMIGHINGIRNDNKIENLRLATPSQKQQSSRGRINKASGLPKGIFLGKRGNYRCRITVSGNRIYLGSFASLELAEQAIKAAREKYHGEFANHE